MDPYDARTSDGGAGVVIVVAMSVDLVVSIEDYDHVPAYDEIVLSQAQIDEMRERHPNALEERIVWHAKMSVMAKVRHRLERNADGSPKFGGAQKGAGRPSKRLGEAFKEWADDNHSKIIDGLAAGLDKDEDPAKRHKAAVNILKQRLAEDKIEMKERATEGMNRDDLTTAFVSAVAKRIKDGDPQAKSMLQAALASIASGDAPPESENVIDIKPVQS